MNDLIQIRRDDQFFDLIACLLRCRIVAVDTETDGITPYQGSRMIGASFWFPEYEIGYYLPLRHVDFNAPDWWWNDLRDAYPRYGVSYVFFNAMFDLHMFHVEGFCDPYRVEDVMLAAQLINENENNRSLYPDGSFKLKYLAQKYLGSWASSGETELKQRAKELGLNPKSEMWKMPSDDVWYYAAMDTKITWLLREFYRPYLEEWQQWELYQFRNEALLNGYYPMAKHGLLVDREQAERLLQEEEQLAHEARIQAETYIELYTGWQCNIDSPTQLKQAFGMLGTPVKSTAVGVLEELDTDLARLITAYRTHTKAIRTYYRPYLEMLDDDNRLHLDTYMIGTVTGRVSSRLQQMPRKKGYSVKKIFVPPPEHVLVQIDYSNLELRLATHFAQEPTMRRLFHEGVDLHRYTADRIVEQMGYSLVNADEYDSEEKAAKEERQLLGKTPNFSLLYGMSPYRRSLGEKSQAEVRFQLPVEQIVPIVQAWHKTYENFRRAGYAAKVLSSTARPNPTGNGAYRYLRLFNGRVRHFDPFANNGVHPPYKDALNFLVQGTGAAMTEISLTRIAQEFDPSEVMVVQQIHDAVLLYVRKDLLDDVIPDIVAIMEDFPQFDPEIKVDVEVSEKSWGDLQPYER